MQQIFSRITSQTAPLIAVEEYYLSAVVPLASHPNDEPALHLIPETTRARLRNLGASRARDMRAHNTTLQILSHVPIDTSLRTCQKLNDALHAAIVMYPDRYAAMALLPCWGAKEAASELQRCVDKYKFVGGILGYRRGGWDERQYDAQAFEELWAVAARYKVPIALRPLFPSMNQVSDSGHPVSPKRYLSSSGRW